MPCFGCTFRPGGGGFAALSRAAAKSAAARLRKLGALTVHPNWAARAAVCERCPLRTLSAGVSYCGQPFLTRIDRTSDEGCGCPTHDKAKSPAEHCPLAHSHRPAIKSAERCDCKWCTTLSVRRGER